MIRSAVLLCLFGLQPAASFDVASIRLSQPGPNGWAATRIALLPGGRTFEARNAPVKRLIMTAYEVTDAQVRGGPDWTESRGFDIDARSETSSSQEQMMPMLRTLLSDRFKLQFRRELRTMRVETIVLNGHKPNLQQAADTTIEPAIAIRGRNKLSVIVEGHNVSTAFLAGYLSVRLHRTVIDRTGLAGSFDFRVEVPIDQGESQDSTVAETDVTAHIFGDLADSLGLKLKLQNASIEVFSVDHLEMPAGN